MHPNEANSVHIAHLSIDPVPPHSMDRIPEADTTLRY